METKPHVCPVWVGYLMNSPLRKLQQNPDKLLKPYIARGMKILEIGPAMGYFSIPMAHMTGSEGIVYCVDIQENMLKKLEERAKRKGVEDSIFTHLAGQDSINLEDLSGEIDFALLAYVVHEIPDKSKFFNEIYTLLNKDSRVLFIEPRMHVSEAEWNLSLSIARECGFVISKEVKVSGSRACELVRG